MQGMLALFQGLPVARQIEELGLVPGQEPAAQGDEAGRVVVGDAMAGLTALLVCAFGCR
jgi:uracil-DNA glycosylase